MESILNIISNLNQECTFSEKIKETKYSEKNNLDESNVSNVSNESNEVNYYNNFVLSILDNYDMILSNTHNNKHLIFNQRIIDISSDIEDKRDIFYDKFNYNEKVFPIHKIQQSLQLSSKKKRLLSSIYYFNDLYETHFVLVDIQNKRYLETCMKNYPKKYLNYHGNKYSLSDSLDKTYQRADQLYHFENDISKNIYKLYLKPIGHYKINELKEIAIELNLPLKKDKKNKIKKEIYDDINLFKMNN